MIQRKKLKEKDGYKPSAPVNCSAKVKFILQREDGKTGSITRDSDLGLQIGMIDPLSQCKIIGMEEIY